MTGKHPNKHGIFDFARFNPANYGWSINNGSNIQSKTIWQILSEHNKRVVVLNLPYTYPPYQVNGIIVSGWDAPFNGEAFSYPADVGDEILGRFPDYRANLWISELQPLRNDEHFTELVDKLLRGFEQQAAIASDMLQVDNWDVFMVHFQQTDWIQHKLWTYIEQACADPNDHSSKVELTRKCYRRFDELVGSLLRQVGPVAPTTFLLSDHGFGRLMGNTNPNFYLKQWGYLCAPEADAGLGSLKTWLRRSKSKTIRNLYGSVAKAKNALHKGPAPHLHNSWTSNAGDVLGARGSTWDWSKTKAAVVYAYQMGFVYINLVGRGPLGFVQPGVEYENLITDLITRFRRITHLDTGESLLRDVVRGTESYPKADNDILVPDLVLIPKDGYGFSFSLAESAPKISDEGTHRHNGVVVAHGPLIRKTSPNSQLQLIDVAPTILHLLDLPVPTDMDGRVWEEMFTFNVPVRYEEVDNAVVSVVRENDRAASDIIAHRLQGLGYLE
jgi:predicted AlkP superfamily phosphohydrolase/phosphomutase